MGTFTARRPARSAVFKTSAALLAGGCAALGQSVAAQAGPRAAARAGVHLVGLRNAGQAREVRQAFGKAALWAWDPALHRFVPIVEYRPRRGSALYTEASLAARLHLDLHRRTPARARATTDKPRTVNKPKTTAGPESTAGGSAPVPSGSVPGPWHLVFDEEFNGPGLDTSHWTPYWFSNGSQSNQTAMESSNVSVASGALDLTLTPSSGGLVSSNGKFQFTYGYVEARIYLPPAGSGIANWPAFWTDGQSWPADGEMDVMEGLGGSACWHFHSDAGGPGGCAGGNFSGWHTYGAEWAPGAVRYFYDGKLVGQITQGITAQPMYLILENSGGSYGGTSMRPSVMKVDYVRVWQH